MSSKKNSKKRAEKDASIPHPRSIVVVGDGWAALGLTAFLSQGEMPVTWIAGSGARIASPMPGVEVGFGDQGGQTWARLATVMDVSSDEMVTGSFLREFRNKAFREPSWTKAPTPEDRKTVRDEMLWEPERVVAPVFEARFPLTLAEIDHRAREKIAADDQVRRIDGAPLKSIQTADGQVVSVTLATGEVLPCEHVYFADRWTNLSAIEGLPKGMAFTRKRNPVGVLQAEFAHDLPVAAGLQEGFYGTVNKEAGEEEDRHVWGYFSSDGSHSYWTICFSSDEGEDNHAIAKKLRKMKNALDKMFSGSGWVAEGKPDFLSNVKGEQVRFEENILFSEGEAPQAPISVSGLTGLFFLTDGYGPTSSMNQVATTLRADGFAILVDAPAVEPEHLGTSTVEQVFGDDVSDSDPQAPTH